jgi:hypothetical protein
MYLIDEMYDHLDPVGAITGVTSMDSYESFIAHSNWGVFKARCQSLFKHDYLLDIREDWAALAFKTIAFESDYFKQYFFWKKESSGGFNAYDCPSSQELFMPILHELASADIRKILLVEGGGQIIIRTNDEIPDEVFKQLPIRRFVGPYSVMATMPDVSMDISEACPKYKHDAVLISVFSEKNHVAMMTSLRLHDDMGDASNKPELNHYEQEFLRSEWKDRYRIPAPEPKDMKTLVPSDPHWCCEDIIRIISEMDGAYMPRNTIGYYDTLEDAMAKSDIKTKDILERIDNSYSFYWSTDGSDQYTMSDVQRLSRAQRVMLSGLYHDTNHAISADSLCKPRHILATSDDIFEPYYFRNVYKVPSFHKIDQDGEIIMSADLVRTHHDIPELELQQDRSESLEDASYVTTIPVSEPDSASVSAMDTLDLILGNIRAGINAINNRNQLIITNKNAKEWTSSLSTRLESAITHTQDELQSIGEEHDSLDRARKNDTVRNSIPAIIGLQKRAYDLLGRTNALESELLRLYQTVTTWHPFTDPMMADIHETTDEIDRQLVELWKLKNSYETNATSRS